MPKASSYPAEFVLSRPHGVVRAPKDFDWVRKNIPCQAACPAGTDIPGYLDAIAHRDYAEAYRINLRDNVFPAVLGRVCTRPCEPACRHGWEGLGEPVAICFSKRSAADFQARKAPVKLDPLFPPTGKRIAIIGGGAAGLTVARELALWGHQATVFERESVPGGLMVLGIPPFRLPRDIVELEIEQIRQVGVDIQCGVEIGSHRSLEDLLADHDAVVVAAGTHQPVVPEWPGSELNGVEHGLGFLRRANQDGDAPVGRHVVVIGGGFTAVDCARTAQRLGAENVAIYYRRSVAEMYISEHELQELGNEGIAFHPLSAPVAFDGDAGQVTEARFTTVMLGEPDASGRRAPIPLPDSEFTVPADQILLATGQQPDMSWLAHTAEAASLSEAHAQPGASPQVGNTGLFIAGDFALGALSLIDAIGHAKACAQTVDTYLMGRKRRQEVVVIEDAAATGRTREMDEIPRQPMPTLPVEERTLNAEVEVGQDEEAAVTEAQRCYLCHYKYEIDNDLCIYCDRCLKVKPVENCIVKVSALNYDEAGRITGYEPSTSSRDYNLLFIDQNECIRCGACAEVCPVECISLQKVSLQTRKTAE